MATAAEKEALGLQATATDAEVMARITTIVAPSTAQPAAEQHDSFVDGMIEALGLPLTATDEEVMTRIAALVKPIEGVSADLAFEKPIPKLIIWRKNGQQGRRGTYVIPGDRSLVLDESQMDPIDLAEIDADTGIGKVRTSDPLTPEGDIERYARSPRAASAQSV